MALVYRAVWNDERDNLAHFAHTALRDWVAGKSDGALTVPDEGVADGTSLSLLPERGRGLVRTPHPAQVKVQRAQTAGGGPVLRASFVENRPDGSRWETTVRAWELDDSDPDSPDGPGWLWVDVNAVADGGLDGVSATAPRLVVDLVAAGARPRRRCVELAGNALQAR